MSVTNNARAIGVDWGFVIMVGDMLEYKARALISVETRGRT